MDTYRTATLTFTMPGSAATFPICFMAGRNPPTPEEEEQREMRRVEVR